MSGIWRWWSSKQSIAVSYDLHILAACTSSNAGDVTKLIYDALERDPGSPAIDVEEADEIMLEFFPFYHSPGWGKAISAAAIVHGQVIVIELTYNESAGRADVAISQLLAANARLAGRVSGVTYDPQLDRLISETDHADMVAKYEEGRRMTEQAMAKHAANAAAKKPWWKFW